MERLTVVLAERSYPIYIGQGLMTKSPGCPGDQGAKGDDRIQ